MQLSNPEAHLLPVYGSLADHEISEDSAPRVARLLPTLRGISGSA